MTSYQQQERFFKLKLKLLYIYSARFAFCHELKAPSLAFLPCVRKEFDFLYIGN